MTDLSDPQMGELLAGSGTVSREEVMGISLCPDSLECCALSWAIKDMDRFLDTAATPVLREVIEMRNWLASQYNEYVSGSRECSNCQTAGVASLSPSEVVRLVDCVEYLMRTEGKSLDMVLKELNW